MSNRKLTNENSGIPFAQTEAALRAVFASSRYSSIAPALGLANYFPRSGSHAIREYAIMNLVGHAVIALAGIIVAVTIYSIARRSMTPFSICIILSLPTIMILKKLVPRLYAQTSEESKFVELICFDDRRPVIYLRRFRSEDPPLATVLTRHVALRSVLGRPDEGQPLENLSDLLHTCGPVIAIGRPSDTAIHHRIYRLYVADDHWRDTVSFLLKEAKAVFLHYETSQFLDWELREALKLSGAALFILITNIPREAALDAESALKFLPSPIRELGRQFEYIRKGSDGLASEDYALLAVIAEGARRLYGVKMHWDDVFWTLFSEIVHKLHLAEDVRFTHVPAAYERFAKALSGQNSGWIASLSPVVVFLMALLLGLITLFKWY